MTRRRASPAKIRDRAQKVLNGVDLCLAAILATGFVIFTIQASGCGKTAPLALVTALLSASFLITIAVSSGFNV